MLESNPVVPTPTLINVFLGQINGVPAHVCNGRELHTHLENGKQFADWIKDRIEKYGFQENQDFALVSLKSEIKGRGGDRRSTDYHLTLNMAKELSMVENNDKGREARRYFLAMEKKALAAVGQIVPASPAETLIPSEQQTLSEIVHQKAAPYGENVGKALAEIWSRLHRKFRVAKYNQLPRTQLADAIMYVAGMGLRSVSAPVPVALPGLTTDQQDSINRQLDSLTNLWVFGDGAKGWGFNHLRVAFQVAKWQDIPTEQFPAALALIDSKKEPSAQFCRFVMEARDWFEKNVMGGGEPWTPAIKRKLAKELPQAVNIPARVDWHALAEQVRLAA